MAEFKPTAEQKRAISALGSVTVTAAAGSGKTAVLTRRVLERITGENAIDADRLLIVTFTNAAAEEMRNRIRDGMNALVEADPYNENLLRQQALLSKTEISTIDSFCINLVRDNFFKLNLPADFKPSDNSRLNAVMTQALNETFEEYYKKNDGEFENMLLAFGDCDSDHNTMTAVRTVYDYICSLPFPFEWLDRSLKAYKTEHPEKSEWVNYLVDSTLATAKSVIKNLDNILKLDILTPRQRETTSVDRETVRMAITALESGDYDRIHFAAKTATASMSDMTSKKISLSVRNRYEFVQKRTKNFIGELNTRFASSKDELKEDLSRLLPVITKFCEVIRVFNAVFMQKKAEQGIYSFSDIERMTLELLVTNNNGKVTATEDAQKISSKYDEIMVDEYQDTNDLQDTIFQVLSNNGKKLFTVGDAKQSIYRFRQANPENFINRIQKGKNDENVEVITLANNFRSRSGICSFSNFVFSAVMNKTVGDIDYNDNNHLVFGAKYYPERTSADVVAEIIDTNSFTPAEASAHRIADTIKRMIATECVTDKNTGLLRKARYADFAILASSRTDFREICKVLGNYNIPIWTDEDTPLNSAKEINWALSIIKIVCNPTLDVAFLSAMLSPAFGFSAEEAANIKIETKRCNTLFERVKKASQNGNLKCSRMLSILSSLRKDINSMPLDMFVHKMYEKTGLISYASALNDGAGRRANLLKLCEIAAEYESFGSEPGGFAHFVENSDSLNIPKTANETDDVVKLMSVHRSKGLEFPVVFLVSLGASVNKQDINGKMVFDRKLGIGLKLTDRNRRLSYSPFCREAASAAAEAALKSERIRLLYVAMTRAAETLVILFPSKKPEDTLSKAAAKTAFLFDGNDIDTCVLGEQNSFADILLPVMLTHPDMSSVAAGQDIESALRQSDCAIDVIFSTAEDNSEIALSDLNDLTDSAVVELMKQKLLYKYPYLDLNKIASKYSVTSMLEQKTDRDYFYSTRPEFESAGGLTPTERGTAMHRFLEVSDFANAALDLENEISRLSQNGFMSVKQALSLDRKKLAAFFSGDIYKRICLADEVFRELRFMTEEPALSVNSTLSSDYSNEKVVIQGIADCVIEENGELTVIDYKTDRVKEMSELSERYAEQLRIYSKCIEKCLKKPVKECIIYSLFKNDSIILRKV